MRFGVCIVLFAAVLLSSSSGEGQARLDAPKTRTPWSQWLSNGDAAGILSGRHSARKRARAAKRLGLRGDPARATTTLAENLLVERQGAVRLEIATSLLRLARPEALDALASATEIGSGRDTEALSLALGEIANTYTGKPRRRALAILVKMLERRSVAGYAKQGLQRAGAGAIPALLAMMRKGEQTLSAISLLGHLKAQSAVPSLIPLTAHSTAIVRIAALRALAKIGDPRAAHAAAQALESSEKGVVLQALSTLAVVGNETYTPFLENLIKDDQSELRSEALRTWLELDPNGAEPILATMLASDDLQQANIAAQLALASPSAHTASLLYGILQEGSRADAATSAIANLKGGLGTSILLEEAARLQKEKKETRTVLRALAISARQFPPSARQWTLIRQALSTLAPQDAVLFSALAGDPNARKPIIGLLKSEAPKDRTLALWGLWYLPRNPSLIRKHLDGVENKAEFRLLAHVAIHHKVAVREEQQRKLSEFLADEDTKTAALLWSAMSIHNASTKNGQRVRKSLRTLLRDEDSAYHRAIAAWGLALADDRQAGRALLWATTDSDTHVRRAAARALMLLLRDRSPHPHLSDLSEALARNARAEPDPSVRQMLKDAALAQTRRPVTRFAQRGIQTLQFAVAEDAVVGLDVILSDGRWLRLSNLPSGEMFVPDLLAGTQANVNLRVGD